MKSRFMFFGIIGACLLMPMLGLAQPVTLTDLRVGNVSPRSAWLCWEVSGSDVPVVQVFADAEATVELTEEIEIEVYPLMEGIRLVNPDYDQRVASQTLREQTKDQGVRTARLSGLTPATEYFLFVRAYNENHEEIGQQVLGPVALKTPEGVDFVSEARQVVVDFTGLRMNPEKLDGALVEMSMTGAAYPLMSVVGDVAGSQKAYFDLSHFTDEEGARNLRPSGETTLSIRVRGTAGLGDGVLADTKVDFVGETLVALSKGIDFTVDGFEGEFEVSINLPSVVAGVPTPLAIYALTKRGQMVESYERAVDIEVMGAEMGGDGFTAPLEAGYLAEHLVTFSQAGIYRLILRDPQGGIESFKTVEVLDMNFENYRHLHYPLDSELGVRGADEDGDLLDNEVEFALALDPRVFDEQAFTLQKVDGELGLVYPLNRYQTEFDVKVEYSRDLVSWNEVEGSSRLLATRGEAAVMFRSLESLAASSEDGFYRILVAAR